MKSKEKILDECYESYEENDEGKDYYDYQQRALLLELLADIRDLLNVFVSEKGGKA